MFWRDIKSAPMCKDSSVPQARVLVTRISINGHPPVMVAFLTVKGWRWASKRHLPFEPTHWRPLPKPPGYYKYKVIKFLGNLRGKG